ncbi:MAG: sialidase family protein, partial [Acidimicrobiia bacterium]
RSSEQEGHMKTDKMKQRGLALSTLALLLALVACSPTTGERSKGSAEGAPGEVAQGVADGSVVAPAKQSALTVSKEAVVAPEGALNPTTAYDPKAGALYLAWAREKAGQPPAKGKDAKVEAVVARSDDGGKTFAEPVVASAASDRVRTYTISPTQVAVGRQGEVYVLYLHNVPSDASEYLSEYGQSSLRVVRSDDGGRTFSAPAEIAGADVEGVQTTMEMATLFVAPDGDLYISFLDERANLAAATKADPKAEPAYEATQMRIVRSADGGRTWSKSTLVAEPTCGCCSTKVAQGTKGTLFASTRSDWKELKDSTDRVRDVFVSASGDDGVTWGKPTKVHDDRFKISGCPDVHAGLAVDSTGRLHTAWFTGTERHPGVFYAYSDDDGKTFSRPLTLLTDEWVPYGDVKLSLDGQDRPWVVFEDRRAEADKIILVRVDPERGAAAFSTSWAGTAPDLAAGKDWALVAWQTNPGKGEEEEGAGSVRALVARPGA